MPGLRPGKPQHKWSIDPRPKGHASISSLSNSALLSNNPLCRQKCRQQSLVAWPFHGTYIILSKRISLVSLCKDLGAGLHSMTVLCPSYIQRCYMLFHSVSVLMTSVKSFAVCWVWDWAGRTGLDKRRIPLPQEPSSIFRPNLKSELSRHSEMFYYF